MGERDGPDMLLSGCGHERPKSSPSASSDFPGSSRLGQGHHGHPGPSLRIWTKGPSWEPSARKCLPEQDRPGSR